MPPASPAGVLHGRAAGEGDRIFARIDGKLVERSSKGIDGNRLSAVGYGEAAPVAPNDTPENMFKNRRVELVVTKN